MHFKYVGKIVPYAQVMWYALPIVTKDVREQASSHYAGLVVTQDRTDTDFQLRKFALYTLLCNISSMAQF